MATPVEVPTYITHDRREELAERNAKLDVLIQYVGGDEFNSGSRYVANLTPPVKSVYDALIKFCDIFKTPP